MELRTVSIPALRIRRLHIIQLVVPGMMDNILFGYIEIESEEKWSASSETEICRKWWHFMADIMETNPDESPVSVDLNKVFHLD